MARSVIAAVLPPLLPTPTSCVGLTPPPASYVCRRSEEREKLAGRASSSNSWIDDKADRNGGKMPGRASLSSSWVHDKELGRAGKSNSSVERAGRPMWRETCWSGGKRPASRAPSADRAERKHKPLVVVKAEAAPATAVAVKTESAPATIETAMETNLAIAIDAKKEAAVFAGPSFIMSPDPSELPMPSFLILPRQACGTADI